VSAVDTFVALPARRAKDPAHSLALQLPFARFSESMGNHDSNIVDACSVD